jgi:hypothetical protein
MEKPAQTGQVILGLSLTLGADFGQNGPKRLL